MPRSIKCFKSRLEELSGRPIELRINKNVTSLLTVTPIYARARKGDGGPCMKVSINYIFLDAPREVMCALGSFIKRANKTNRAIIRRFINENYHLIDAPDTPLKTEVKGKYFNLATLVNRLNNIYFNGKLKVNVTWAPSTSETMGAKNVTSVTRSRRRKKSVRCIQFATYDEKRRLIRVNPRLDVACVPRYFLEFVLFHEMLHAIVPPRMTETGCMCYHTPEFHRRERLFRQYDQAVEWERDCLSRL